MRFFLYAIFALIFFASAPAQAQQQSLSDLLNDRPAQKQPQEQKLLSVNDNADYYFNQCLKDNLVPEMEEYAKTQCACAAARAASFMEPKEFAIALNDHPDRDFQMGRVILNAYIPCLNNSVNNLVLDECVAGKLQTEKLTNTRDVCECMADGMADYAEKRAELLFFNPRSENILKESSNKAPLERVISDVGFTSKYRYFTRRCIRTEEYNR